MIGPLHWFCDFRKVASNKSDVLRDDSNIIICSVFEFGAHSTFQIARAHFKTGTGGDLVTRSVILDTS